MKIAFVIMSMELGGGAEHDIVHLSTGLKKAGHQPIVITSGGRLCQDLEKEGVPVVLCPLWTRDPLELWKNGKKLAQILEQHGSEIVNPQGVYPTLSAYWASRRLLKRGRSIPNVVTIHMLNRVTWWYYKLAALLINHYADHVIVESNCERSRLQGRGMTIPTTVLHNCFPPEKILNVKDTREEIRHSMGWADGQVVIIVPARMEPQKGHEVLLQALAMPELPRLPIMCYLAGEGSLLERNKALAEQLEVASKVCFGGFRRDMPRLYKGADIFLLSSRYESLPLSIREGMVAGLPVISTNVSGVAEAVEDGESGILVPSGDAKALAQAIVRLTLDKDLRAKMGQRGVEISHGKFNYDSWISGTIRTMEAIRERFKSTLA
jgi:glycosyltransferase involved in cell wall biosynthesis